MTPASASSHSARPRLPIGVLIAVVLTLVCFHRLAFTDLILARGDTFAYFYPYWGARDAALRAGQLPLWSPDLFMGVPLLANSQLGTFYPPNWLTIYIPPPDAVRISVLLHVAWAFMGAFVLARRTLGVGIWAAVVGGALFAFGGYLGGRVEQINQLQGLSWMPWLFTCFDWAISARENRGRANSGRPTGTPLRVLLLGVGLALQFFSGHTQTVFITGFGLGVYALTRPATIGTRVRAIVQGALTLALAGLLALILALPQLLPTLELTSVSNRRGGLNPNQATAFSFSPFAAGRGLLPNYDTPIFGEYIAYIGVIGLGLVLIGLLPTLHPSSSAPDGAGERARRKALARLRSMSWGRQLPYIILMIVGLALAFGLYNPLYWTLASLPGFNWFRVPARWLALFALGAALVAAYGLHTWTLMRPQRRLIAFTVVLIVGALAAGAWFLSARNPDGTPITPPETLTLIGWGAALLVLMVALWFVRDPRLVAALLLIELFAASRFQTFNDLVPREVYTETRFTAAQLGVWTEGDTLPGRMLSISETLFDPGDRAALEARYQALGMSDAAIRTALTDTKLAEVLAPNLPLAWGIPTIDGFDGGVLPTAYYTAFTSLMLPEGELRTVDGRLRESLASEACGGACIPDQRWLNMTDTRYLVIDKVFDLWREGVAYDTALEMTPTVDNPARYTNVQRFEADTVDLVYACAVTDCAPPAPDIPAMREVLREPLERYQLIRYALPAAVDLPEIVVIGDGNARVRAVTLVDRRTIDDPRGIDFQQLSPQPFTRILSSDIKLYENSDVLPRAFVVYDALIFPDTDLGTEMALEAMRAPDFDPLRTVILNLDSDQTIRIDPTDVLEPRESLQVDQWAEAGGSGQIEGLLGQAVEYVQTQSDRRGWLVILDAYYPGWQAQQYRDSVPLMRANVMFRAIPIQDGVGDYKLSYFGGETTFYGYICGGFAWLVVGIILLVICIRTIIRLAPKF